MAQLLKFRQSIVRRQIYLGRSSLVNKVPDGLPEERDCHAAIDHEDCPGAALVVCLNGLENGLDFKNGGRENAPVHRIEDH